MVSFKFRKAWHVIIFVTFSWSIPFEIYLLIFEDKYLLNFSTFLETFSRCIIGGFCMGIVAYFGYRWKQNQVLKYDRPLTGSTQKKSGLLKISVLSSAFFIGITSFIPTFILVYELLTQQPIGVTLTIMRYVLAVLLGFLIQCFLLIVKKCSNKWKVLTEKLEKQKPVSGIQWFRLWIYSVGVICLCFCVGMGTIQLIIMKIMDNYISFVVPIYKLYFNNMIIGFCAGNIGFITMLYIKKAPYRKNGNI